LPQYAHIDGGVCYSCMGMGKWFVKAQKLAK
jgi:hypothetical protein